MKKSTKTWLIVLFVILLLGIVGYFVIQNFQLQSELNSFNTSTDFTWKVIDKELQKATDETDAVNVSLYYLKITDLTADEIEEQKNDISKYTLKGTYDDGDTVAVEADYIYRYVASGTDFVPVSAVPVLGVNLIEMLNETEDVAMLAYATDSLSPTINQTAFREWTIMLQTLDAAESSDGEKTNLEGYTTNYNFTDDTINCVVLRIEFNTTADASWCAFNDDSYTTDEHISGVYIYYEIDCDLVGEADFKVKFSSAIGTTFEVIGMAICYGYTGSVTVWDSQN